MSRSKKLLWRTLLLTAILGVLIWIFFVQPRYVTGSDLPPALLRGNTSNEKNQSHLLIQRGLNEGSVLLQGSSELSALETTQYHPSHLYNAKDANAVMIGAGYYQSLLHSFTLASVEPDLPSKKAALIVSIQWFNESGTTGEQAVSRFSKEHFLRMLTHPGLSTELKDRLIQRTEALFRDDAGMNDWVQQAVRFYKGSAGPVERLAFQIGRWNDQFSRVHKFRKENHGNEAWNRPETEKATFAWDDLLRQAEADGKGACTNNPYYIENSYYARYIEERLESLKGSEKETRYSYSPEYRDLELYLDVAKELKVEVALFLIPPQGFWSDVTELPKDSVNQFVANIQELTAKYDNVTIYDHTPHSHEPYYFKDIMHLGWKGWVYVQKDLREFQTKP